LLRSGVADPLIASWQLQCLPDTMGSTGSDEEVRMRILVLGSGTLATSLASRLRKAGHIAGTHQELDDVAMLRTLALGARVVFLVVPFHKCLDLPHRVFLARVVADATDYFPSLGSDVPTTQGLSPSEVLAAHLHGASFVRIVNADSLLSISEQEPVGGSVPRVTVPIAGEDPAAKAAVADLIADLGLDAVDIGTLADARTWRLESPLSASSSNPVEAMRIRSADV
jgi:predicted dinucleotide-binding enzyme